MNKWCLDIPNKPHIIVIDIHQRKCYNCNKELPHFTIVHSVPKTSISSIIKRIDKL